MGNDLEAKIILEFSDKKSAQVIATAVSPENFRAPIDFFIKTTYEDTQVITELKSEGKLATFLATIDDLLFSVSTAEKVLEMLKK